MITQIIAVIIGIIFLVVTTIFWIVTRKSEKKITVLPNSPFIEIDNSRTRFTNGYHYGIMKKRLPRKNNTFYIEFYPIDVTQGENIERPEIQRLIVAKEFIKYPKKSSRRQTIQTIARNPMDIPEEIINTQVGKELIEEGKLAFIEKAFSDSIPGGDEQVRNILMKSYRGLGKDFIKHLEDQSRASNQIANAGKTQPESK